MLACLHEWSDKGGKLGKNSSLADPHLLKRKEKSAVSGVTQSLHCCCLSDSRSVTGTRDQREKSTRVPALPSCCGEHRSLLLLLIFADTRLLSLQILTKTEGHQSCRNLPDWDCFVDGEAIRLPASPVYRWPLLALGLSSLYHL